MTDKLAQIAATPHVYANEKKTPWVLIDADDRDALVEIARAAQESVEADAEAAELCAIQAYHDDTRCVESADALAAAVARLKENE